MPLSFIYAAGAVIFFIIALYWAAKEKVDYLDGLLAAVFIGATWPAGLIYFTIRGAFKEGT